MTELLTKLLQKGVIIKSVHEIGEIISPIFLRDKPDGSHRVILNLKATNAFVDNSHFKMETIRSILKLIYPNCYMASIDLKDAYYSVKIHDSYQKYLKFQFQGALYAFTCLPNGLCTGPRKFTKLCKPPLAHLRTLGHTVCAYIDDLINIGDNFVECQHNVCDTITTFCKLGFNVNHKKSKLIPSQTITFLGFNIDSVHMKITPTHEKILNVQTLCRTLLGKTSFKIRFLARIIGTLISTFPGVKHGPLHFRILEALKTRALRDNKGKFDRKMCLSVQGKTEILWWLDNIASAENDIYIPNPHMEISTDASNTGWGGVCPNPGGRKLMVIGPPGRKPYTLMFWS